GINRYETAKIIAEEVENKVGSVNTAIIAYGENFPDALSASSFAGYKKYPILLALNDSIPSYTQAALNDLGISNTIIVGGEGVISSTVESQLPNPIRKWGQNRYETSVEISNYGVSQGLSWNKTMFATGENFPDALAGGTYGAIISAPMLLVYPTSLDVTPDTKNSLQTNKANINTCVFLGGTGAVSQAVENSIKSLLQW
ncbi:MAG: cell wall-binding repeat-containing protein, partial [Actinomycetia bacterium]|nr:cell wall-binding repeat-containing protein [Actinomycetes bacterium]